jgi:hypothetical protein
MRGEPSHGAAHLGDDAVEPGGRRQGVFDDREIDPERKQALGKEGEILLNQIVDLPIAAVDKGQRRRLRVGGKKEIEPLAGSIAVSEVKMAGAFTPHPDAARRPTGDNRVALGDGRGVVVGGIELGMVHSPVQHGAGSGHNSAGGGSYDSLLRDRRQSVKPEAGSADRAGCRR